MQFPNPVAAYIDLTSNTERARIEMATKGVGIRSTKKTALTRSKKYLYNNNSVAVLEEARRKEDDHTQKSKQIITPTASSSQWNPAARVPAHNRIIIRQC